MSAPISVVYQKEKEDRHDFIQDGDSGSRCREFSYKDTCFVEFDSYYKISKIVKAAHYCESIDVEVSFVKYPDLGGLLTKAYPEMSYGVGMLHYKLMFDVTYESVKKIFDLRVKYE